MTTTFTLIKPFIPPAGSVRALSVTEMFRVVPSPLTDYGFGIGVDPKVKDRLFTIQNRSDTPLNVWVTLPSYLRFKDEQAPIVVAPNDGRVTFAVTFDEQAALAFNPGDFSEKFVFDIFPAVTGPVYVFPGMPLPPDPNPVEGAAVLTPSNGIEAPTVVIKTVPAEGPQALVDGTTGDLIDLTDPNQRARVAGWIIAADGRAYPPLAGTTAQTAADVDTETGVAPLKTEAAPTNDLERLVLAVKTFPESFVGATRRGFIIDPLEFMDGVNPSRVERECIDMLVGDIGIDTQFKIINWAKTTIDGTAVPAPSIKPPSTLSSLFQGLTSALDAVNPNRTKQFFTLVETAVDQVRAAKTFDDLPNTDTRQYTVTANVWKLNDKNERFGVRTSLTEDDIQLIRSIVTATAIIREITVNGKGVPAVPR